MKPRAHPVGRTTALRRLFILLLIATALPLATAEETYQERMARLDRERQAQQDLDSYMERWRADRAI